MRKDFSTFKFIGITLLVTMSSCVVGSMELNAEIFRNWELELNISSSDKTQVVAKQKKSKVSSAPKFKIGHIIESARTKLNVPALTFDYTPIIFKLRFAHFPNILINKIVVCSDLNFATAYHGINFHNRAGPSALSC